MYISLVRRSPRRAAWPLGFAAVLCLALTPTMTAIAAERGLPQITVYPAETHQAGPQSFDLAQDSRGILYFGNLQGLLTYDGAWWRLLKLPDDQAALSVATDAQGRVALGMVSDFGYLVRNAAGEQAYRSLLPRIPAAQRTFGDVRSICAFGGGFLYVAEKGLLVWDGKDGARVAASLNPETAPRGCMSEGGRILLRGPLGLQQFDPVTNKITPAGLDGQRVVYTVSLSDGTRADGKIVAAVRDQGLFLVDGTTATPWAADASAWLKGKTVSGGSRLHDGRIAITTRQHGLVILNGNDGAIEQIVGADAGLPDALLNEARVDRDGSLWLAME